jgi:hypothetical protein
MTTLDRKLAEIAGQFPDYPVITNCSLTDNMRRNAADLEAGRKIIPALLRLVAVLREQRDIAVRNQYVLGSDQADRDNAELDAAALAAMEGT